MTNEEFRFCVYNQYRCGSLEGSLTTEVKGIGIRSPENCYEILNERRNTQPANRRYSQYDHYYKIKW